MRYAKLKDGAIEFAPRKIQMDGATVYNPVPDKLTALGYLPVVTSDPGEAPEDRAHLKPALLRSTPHLEVEGHGGGEADVATA